MRVLSDTQAHTISKLVIHLSKYLIQPASCLAVISFSVGLSSVYELQLEKDIIFALLRAYLQLSVVGFVWEFILAKENAGWMVLVYLVTVIIAGFTAGNRAKRVPYANCIAGISIFVGTSVTMSMFLAFTTYPFTPLYIIPIVGMVIERAMTVTGTALECLRAELLTDKSKIEASLALGATARQASLPQVKRALIIAVTPTWDHCKTVGLISLPGSMAGLIMGGASTAEALQYQMALLSMIINAAAFSSIMATCLSWHLYFTKTQQLEIHILSVE